MILILSTLTAMIVSLFSCSILHTIPKLPSPITPRSIKSLHVNLYTYKRIKNKNLFI
jgi:hypothetical protein